MCCKNYHMKCCIDNFILMIFILLLMLLFMIATNYSSKIVSFIFFICFLLFIFVSYRLIEYGLPENCKKCITTTDSNIDDDN